MRFSAAAAGALALAGSAFAAPVASKIEARAPITDLVILQFALTLEHLENVFYKEALKTFTLADFEAAGYSEDYYNNLKYVAFDEETHVVALSAAIESLGEDPVAAGEYSFPYTDVPSFIYLSGILEGVGVGAYSGAAALIKDDYYLTVAASILAVEALHTSYQRTALGEVPFANPFETPLGANAVFTLASAFIVSLPPSNYQLPFVAFPGLVANGAPATCEQPDCSSPSVYVKRGGHPHGYAPAVPPSVGDVVSFTADAKIPAGSYLTFQNGIAIASVSATIKGKTIEAAIPDAVIGGQTYVFVTSADITGDFSDYSDDVVLYGPAVIEVNPAPPVIHYKLE